MWYNVLFFMGLLMLVISLFLVRDRIRFIRKGSVTTASVIKLVEDKDSDGDRNYKPVFKFTTHAKKEVIFKYKYSSGKTAWHVGEKVRIAYDNNFPEKAVVLTYVGAFGYIMILIAAGILLLTISVGYYLAEYFFKQV